MKKKVYLIERILQQDKLRLEIKLKPSAREKERKKGERKKEEVEKV